MSLGYTSDVVNGQLVHIAPKQGFSPLTFGASYTGPGFWPRGGVYNVPPVMPAPGTWEGSQVVAGMINANQPPPSPGKMRSDGTMNYYHPTKSPLWWGLGFLVGGMLLLKKVHYA